MTLGNNMTLKHVQVGHGKFVGEKILTIY